MFCGIFLRYSFESMIMITFYTCMASSDEVYLRMMVTFISSHFRFLFLMFTLIYQLSSFVRPLSKITRVRNHVAG